MAAGSKPDNTMILKTIKTTTYRLSFRDDEVAAIGYNGKRNKMFRLARVEIDKMGLRQPEGFRFSLTQTGRQENNYCEFSILENSEEDNPDK
jgi:hypothetical protein